MGYPFTWVHTIGTCRMLFQWLFCVLMGYTSNYAAISEANRVTVNNMFQSSGFRCSNVIPETRVGSCCCWLVGWFLLLLLLLLYLIVVVLRFLSNASVGLLVIH